MKDLLLLLIGVLALAVAWPRQPDLLITDPGGSRRSRLNLEDTSTLDWVVSLRDLRPEPEPDLEPLPAPPPPTLTLLEQSVVADQAERLPPGRHRAEPVIGGKPIYGAPRERTVELPGYEYDPRDSTAAIRMGYILSAQHTAAENELRSLPEWARNPEGQQ